MTRIVGDDGKERIVGGFGFASILSACAISATIPVSLLLECFVQGLTAAKIAPNSTIRVSVLSSDTQVLSSSLQLMMNREEALA